MKIIIHRGANEIGGNCVEIEHDGVKIVIDAGIPIECEKPEEHPLPMIQGFHEYDANLLAVLLSHSHFDHYGLLDRLPAETKVFMGKATKAILEVARIFTPAGYCRDSSCEFVDRTTVSLGPFNITPFLVDHSAFDSYAFLIEAGGKKVFYTGDFRDHGRKSKMMRRFFENPPSDIALVLMEGTNVREMDSQKPEVVTKRHSSEAELETEFAEIFGNEKGIHLVWSSSQNVDRIVTIFKACRKAGKRLIMDLYTAELLRSLENPRLPQAGWEGVQVYLPKSQKWNIIQKQRFDVASRYSAFRVYPEQLADVSDDAVMLFRPSMVRDIELANIESIAGLICSVWAGYLDRPEYSSLHQWLASRNIPLRKVHTSGHASLDCLGLMRAAFPKAHVVPIHTKAPNQFPVCFDGAYVVDNGESLEI